MVGFNSTVCAGDQLPVPQVSAGPGGLHQSSRCLPPPVPVFLFLNTPGDKHSAKIFITNQNISATSRLQAAAATVKSELPWPTSGPGATDYHSPGDFSHHLDRNYSPHPYANMTPSGRSCHTSAGEYAPWGGGWRVKLLGGF